MRIERETTIEFNDKEEMAFMWTSSPVVRRHMAKVGILPTRIAKNEGKYPSCCYEIPKTWIKIRKPIVRNFSEKQRAAVSAATKLRFRLARERKQQPSEQISPEA